MSDHLPEAFASEPEPPSATAPRLTRLQPPFPPVVWLNHRGYVVRGALNRYKDCLLAFAQGVEFQERDGAYDDGSFVPLKQVAAERGVGRRTIGRRIVDSQREVA
jgi:hypothetical protein